MKIEFDPAKRENILFRRGLDLAAAGELLIGKCLTDADDRFDYGEGSLDIGWTSERRHRCLRLDRSRERSRTCHNHVEGDST